MSFRVIGQEDLGIELPRDGHRSSLDDLTNLIDWAPTARQLDDIHSAVNGEPAWLPLALFKVLLISIWYDCRHKLEVTPVA